MKAFSTLVALASLVASAVAQEVTGSTGVRCSGLDIDLAAIQAATERALEHLNDGRPVGRNNYPHQFNNRERFRFNAGCRRPYYEFPLTGDGPYEGGDPGPHRVVIGSWDETDAAFCGAITHLGAARNNFLQCANT